MQEAAAAAAPLPVLQTGRASEHAEPGLRARTRASPGEKETAKAGRPRGHRGRRRRRRAEEEGPRPAAGLLGAAAPPGRAAAGGDGEAGAGAALLRGAVAAVDAADGAGAAGAGAGVDGARGAEEDEGGGQGREEGSASHYLADQPLAWRSVGSSWLGLAQVVAVG